ncbi:unnamed protein product [Protopolystoma xenopodis]|uniref:Uncharacterized protein n=1 Tax=Protopolystoma xenopodis TaxID=117903 RepID=A0A448XS90_9PLAT|nr:unnamed protein product [Protopolystoma xenopodis]
MTLRTSLKKKSGQRHHSSSPSPGQQRSRHGGSSAAEHRKNVAKSDEEKFPFEKQIYKQASSNGLRVHQRVHGRCFHATLFEIATSNCAVENLEVQDSWFRCKSELTTSTETALPGHLEMRYTNLATSFPIRPTTGTSNMKRRECLVLQ